MTTTETIIEVRGLGKSFGSLVAVDDVSFTIRRGEILGIAGPNGAGKTTLFNLITRNPFGPDRGEVVFDGHRIDRLKPHRIMRLGL
ncbi:ATP-binding cassette domain-containing protein, partial [Bauldia litoralis]